MASWIGGMVGDSLFEQRIRTDRASLESLAVRIAPTLAQSDAPALQRQLIAAGGELGGRVLLLDQNGKVQLDSYGEIQGTRLEYPEIVSILVKGQNVDYGVHELETGVSLDTSHLLFARRSTAAWVGYCTAGVVYASDVIGVLLLVSPVQEIMQNLYQLQDQMVLIFAAIALTSLICAWVFSRVITRPIAGLNRGIQKMSKGDFSARVKVRGSGEMKQLARAFNSMSEKLETLDQSRNQFVSNASHELKTPLATMKIMIESLIYQPDMDKNLRTEFMTDINNEIDRLSAIVSDLLTLVQMDSQNVKLTRENLSIAQLIKENAHRLTPIANQKGQKIVLQLQDSCDIYADKSKLNQVIYNLMENAVKYTQASGVIRVTLQRQGRNAIFRVSDNGPGIPKENLPHIFDRFYRVDKARSREKGGTGLGLSIVHQMVLAHGGSVTVDSEEGQGSTFTVELPIHQG